MNRQQKETVVADLAELFTKAQAAFLVNYKGATVSQLQKLRSTLRSSQGLLRVAKARLLKKAVNSIPGAEQFKDELHDQVGIVFAFEEVPIIAKELVNYCKSTKKIYIISGLFEKQTLGKDRIEFLAHLPSRTELLSQLLAVMQAPVSSLARLLNQPLVSLACALEQIAQKKQQENQ